jgi:hypothetical protein
MNVSMRRQRSVATALSLAALACFLPIHLSATTAQVYPQGGTPCVSGVTTTFNSISAAVAGVVSNSTVYVCPGTYAEQVVITKRLTLIGVSGNGTQGTTASGSNNPVITSPASGVAVNSADLYNAYPTAAQIFVQTPTGSVATPIVVKISNIVVDGSNNQVASCGIDLVGIYYQNASGTLDHVVTRYQEMGPNYFGCQPGATGIYVQSGYGTHGTATVTIENNSVHDYQKNGITADGSGTVATIENNYIVGIGATPLTAQNGIQVSDGASGKVTGNTVTDDVYVNSQTCYTDNTGCYSATGILLYDSGGTAGSQLAVTGNTVSNTQGAIVAYTDGTETADYNNVTSNKITTNSAIVVAGATYLLDGIDLCSNHNTASKNTIFYSSGSGVHVDSSCMEPGNQASGNDSSVTSNTVNEACAGVLAGNGSGNTFSGNVSYNVVETTATGDSCPVGNGGPSIKAAGKAKPRPANR